MARPPQELPKNQITPVAKPVDAFINPVNYQVAKPAAPDFLPQVKGITQVGTNSVGSYQGYNQAEQLASSLSKFNPALTGALQTGGVMLAGKIMDDNHKAAVAAAQKAEALLDAQTELSAEERAAAVRKLTAQDSNAGWLMHALNPYRDWGWKRGMNYSLGQKLKTELPQLASQLTGEDYLAADQGMGKLVQLRSEKLAELQGLYGVSENDPSYQNYVLEPFNKASDALTTQVTNDRVKWLDANQPRVIGNNLGQLIQSSLSSNTLEILQPDGTTITLTRTPGNETLFDDQLRQQANKLLSRHGAMAGLPGQRSKWNVETYKDLIARPAFASGTKARQILDNLVSTQPMMGANGKQVVINGERQFMTFGDAFQADALEVDMKRERDLFQQRQRTLTTGRQMGLAAVLAATENMAPGPDRLKAGRAALQLFADQNNLRATPAGRILYGQLQSEMVTALQTQSQIYGMGFDPAEGQKWRLAFDRRMASGNPLGKEADLTTLQNAAEKMGPDGYSWYAGQYSHLEEAYENIDTVGRFPKLNNVIDEFIDVDLSRYYFPLPDNWPDKLESQLRQRTAYINAVGGAIQAEEERLGRELKPGEARELAIKTMRDYGKDDATLRENFFPGSSVYPNAPASTMPGVGTQTMAPKNDEKTPVSEQVDYQRQDLTASPVYKMSELDAMPSRTARIRNWRNEAIIDLVDLNQLVLDQLEGKPLPGQLKRLLRDIRVRDAFQFIDAQLKRYPNYKPQWTPQEYESLRNKWQSSAGLMDNAIATTGLQRRGLNKLASLNDWAYMA